MYSFLLLLGIICSSASLANLERSNTWSSRAKFIENRLQKRSISTSKRESCQKPDIKNIKSQSSNELWWLLQINSAWFQVFP
ncbi:hypothetical protein TNIN_450661 [Trichonephila inaurata madagascariensis]|uniref:Uncharacterized protein n=1 Tax=Trichonephila inaurata madagascariensis TaxID=2747483 RepID=A0A8X6I8X4_9ARAC|nr:hypothetical protein TNIN_450661 [Trichonephila inaurata madagascariensis]